MESNSHVPFLNPCPKFGKPNKPWTRGLIASVLVSTFSMLSANGMAQTLNLELKNTPLTKAFSEVQKATGYRFIYSESIL
ncbi:MAG: hypothetical protein ACN6PN_09540, partial [Sphingobacterium sp.]